MSNESPWRVGRKLRRTLYCGETFVALFDDADLAESVAEKMNDHWNGATYATTSLDRADAAWKALEDGDRARAATEGAPYPRAVQAPPHEAGPMPGAARPLADDVLAVLEKWIDGDELYPTDKEKCAIRDAMSEVRRQQRMRDRMAASGPSSGSADLDPAHCSACAAFVARNAPPGPKVDVQNELWTAANLKAQQLQREINESSATSREKSNLQHTLSKLWMFATDAWDQEVVRPAQRKSDQEHAHAQHSSSPFTSATSPSTTEKKTMKITINGDAHETTAETLTYEDVVKLAGMTGTPSVMWRVKNATGGLSNGIMHTGSYAIVPSEGLVFNVAHTGNA
jgi:FKBP-type peptidyl-prolyl cis-trans isomerase